MRSARRVVPVHYDFASSLCYVAHRVMEELAVDVAGLGIELAWTPLDLARLLGYRRGALVPEERRANAARVAHELGVPLRVPTHWRDSRAWNAASLLAADAGRGAAWREAAWSALYEGEGEPDVERVAASVGLVLGAAALADADARVARLTETARAAEVSGVPTFVLGRWPLGGIQTAATMRHLLGRWAARAGAAAPS